MPSNCHTLSTPTRQEFCLALKAARERKGLSLSEIAEATKIPSSLFAAFERNDLRAWPTGLYRRSFFRDYARMLDVPLTEACAEFARLFCDVEGAPGPARAAASEAVTQPTDDLRLMLDGEWHAPREPMLVRLAAAALDLLVLISFTILATVATGIAPALAGAVLAVTYFSISTELVGETPAKWAIARRQSIVGVAETAEPVEEPKREWVSDARRVGPAPSPHLRFRIRVS